MLNNISNKKYEFNELISLIGKCSKCTNFACSKKSLINIYKEYNFCTNVPSIWTDWFHRLESRIMIIGQDWGPYSDMKKLHEALFVDKSNWKDLIESEKSNTKKLLGEYIDISSKGKYTLDDIFITNAIMCARSGDNYRGDNIDLKKSTLNCSEYLHRQIDIVKPKVILTLGYYPLLSLSNIFDFKIEKTLSATIKNTPEIICDDFVIIPLYHPVAQIKKSDQLSQYNRVWKHINKK